MTQNRYLHLVKLLEESELAAEQKVVMKSTRAKSVPSYLQHYICNQLQDSPSVLPTYTSHALSQVLSYDLLSPKFRLYLLTAHSVIDPKTYQEAVQSNEWQEAMKQEIKAL